MVSTRRRCRLFRPWMVKPCSRVLRKLSGELTTIQYWDERPSERPDFRLRRARPDLAGLSDGCSVGWGSVRGSEATGELSRVSRRRASPAGAARGPGVREGG